MLYSGYEDTRCAFFAIGGPGRFAAQSGEGPAFREEAGGGGQALWGEPAGGLEMEESLRERWNQGVALPTAGTAAGRRKSFALAGGADRSVGGGASAGAIAITFCVMDARGGANADLPEVPEEAFVDDGGAVFEAVGIHAAEAGSAGV